MRVVAAGLLLLMFVCGCKGREGFSPRRAMKHVTTLVEMGPHPSGSENITRVQAYITNTLSNAGLSIREERFTASTPLGPRDMMNIIAISPGRITDIIAIGAHYETKFFSDFTFVGANDNCSGTGLLLDLARVIASRDSLPLEFTYWFIFFDGEESFLTWTESDSLYGSRHLVKILRETGEIYRLKALILLDMIGDRDLQLPRESQSTAWLSGIIWDTARDLGYGAVFLDRESPVVDDHVPFLQAGVSSVDIIDFTFGGDRPPGRYWHTPHDTLDKVSRESLRIVGEVVMESLPRIERYLLQRE
jgi:Iap family predicted aminopeptidase